MQVRSQLYYEIEVAGWKAVVSQKEVGPSKAVASGTIAPF